MSSRDLRPGQPAPRPADPQPPAFAHVFEPRRGQPDWAQVLALDLRLFTGPRSAAPAQLEQLATVGHLLRTAVLEGDPRQAAEVNVARLAHAATLLALDAELESSAAEADLSDAYAKLDALTAQLAASQVRRAQTAEADVRFERGRA